MKKGNKVTVNYSFFSKERSAEVIYSSETVCLHG